jgi:hypothetical protein
MIWLVLSGATAGVLAGLLGVGGGLVLVPALIALGALNTQVAVATSLACIAFTGFSSAYSHHRLGNLRADYALKLVPGLMLGALLGAFLAHHLPSDGLKKAFGVAAVLFGLRMLLSKPSEVSTAQGLSNTVLAAASGVVGVLSALIGIGGGTMIVPLLGKAGLSMKQAVGTSSATTLPIAWAGALGFVLSGWGQFPQHWGYIDPHAALILAITSFLTAPLGAKLASVLPTLQLKRVFALVLVLIGVKMWV